MRAYPFVSFCVVTFNHQAYIYQALQSILNCKFDFEFEIIVGNDKSTDQTNSEIERFVQDNPGVRFFNINRSENLGFIHNYLDVLARGKGDFFLCIDGDDYLEMQGEEQKLRELLCSTKGSLLFSHRILYTDQNRIENVPVRNISLREAIDGVYFHVSSVFIAKKNIDLLLSYDWLDKFHFLDRVLQLDIVRDKKNLFIPNTSLSVYRKHSSSLSVGMSAIYVLDKVTDFIIKYLDFHQGMNDTDKSIFYRRVAANYLLLKHPLHIRKTSAFFKSIARDFPKLRDATSLRFSSLIVMRSIGHYFLKKLYWQLFKSRSNELSPINAIHAGNE